MDPESTVFVASLEKRVTEDILLELFIQAGPVRSVKIPKDKLTGENRTFGFVTFEHEVSVPYASELFNGLRLFQKPITCKPQKLDNAPPSPSASPIPNRSPQSYSPRQEDYLPQSTTHFNPYDDRYPQGGYHPQQSGFHGPHTPIARHHSSPLHRQAVMNNPHQNHHHSYTPSPPHHHRERERLHRRNSLQGPMDHGVHSRHERRRNHPYER